MAFNTFYIQWKSYRYSFLICLLFTLSSLACARNRIVVTQENVSSVFSSENTTYIVRSEINLNLAEINLPQNCIIKFARKGRLVNGVLTGDETQLRGVRKSSLGVELKGTWRVPVIKDSYFDWSSLSDNQILDNISTLLADSVDNHIFLGKPEYRVFLDSSHMYGLTLKSNTKIELKSSIVLEANKLPFYAIIYLSEVDNVKINGGSIVGDVGRHIYMEGNSSQWGFGLGIFNSSNIVVTNMHISKCIGDGIYIGGGDGVLGDFSNASKSITLQKIISEDNRRQGISITYADGVVIKNCVFKDTGKTEFIGPGCGMDIEPNDGQSVRNVIVKNSLFQNNCKNLNVSIGGYEVEGDLCSVEKIRFENCSVTDYLSIRTGSVQLIECDLEALVIHLAPMPKEKVFIKNTRIRGGAGVRIRTVGELLEGEFAPKYVFEGCEIKAGEKSENSLFGTLNHSGYEKMAVFTFNRCKIELPKENKQYRLIQTGCSSNFIFNDCTIVTHGKIIDSLSENSRNCTITTE